MHNPDSNYKTNLVGIQEKYNGKLKKRKKRFVQGVGEVKTLEPWVPFLVILTNTRRKLTGTVNK